MLVSHPTLERSVSGVYGHQVLPPNRSCPKKVGVAETQTQGAARVAPRHAGVWCPCAWMSMYQFMVVYMYSVCMCVQVAHPLPSPPAPSRPTRRLTRRGCVSAWSKSINLLSLCRSCKQQHRNRFGQSCPHTCCHLTSEYLAFAHILALSLERDLELKADPNSNLCVKKISKRKTQKCLLQSV